jgi:hypothetical protein
MNMYALPLVLVSLFAIVKWPQTVEWVNCNPFM